MKHASIALRGFLSLTLAAGCLSCSEPPPNPARGKPVVWFGLDFSRATLIGKQGFTNPEEIKNKYFDGWNGVIISESSKFNLKRFFGTMGVTNDIASVTKLNAQVDPANLVINPGERDVGIDSETLAEMVKLYETDKEGIGLVFVVESLNKQERDGFATVHVVFFDIATRNILETKKVTGRAGGIGLRSYWANSMHRVMESY
jgi:hypothetical protein